MYFGWVVISAVTLIKNQETQNPKLRKLKKEKQIISL